MVVVVVVVVAVMVVMVIMVVVIVVVRRHEDGKVGTVSKCALYFTKSCTATRP
jgi:hypothetical protein